MAPPDHVRRPADGPVVPRQRPTILRTLPWWSLLGAALCLGWVATRPAYDVLPRDAVRLRGSEHWAPAEHDDHDPRWRGNSTLNPSVGASEALGNAWVVGPLHATYEEGRGDESWLAIDDRPFFVSALPEGGRCSSSRELRYTGALSSAVADGGATVITCSSEGTARGAPLLPWSIAVRPRPVRLAWAAALLAVAGLWVAVVVFAGRRPRAFAWPWRWARRDATGRHRLTDGTPVRHPLADAPDELVVLASATAHLASYRVEEAVDAVEAETLASWRARLSDAANERYVVASMLAIGVGLLALDTVVLR